ncbi:unannotated protein [freshwater metagenome]|uniref:Unannotated protein n=1 Tax=freshwater metagenome TaxID=449393 RepID=A0A6J6HMG9_9ZZZZ
MRVESDASGAIRMVRSGTGPAESAVRSEAAILNRVRGPGVVAIVASTEIADGFEFSTSWIGYRSLSTLRRPLSVNRAAGFCLAIGSTLQRIHAVGVVHNRLDPTRVLLDEKGRPTICGFRSASIDSRLQGCDVAALIGLTLWMLDSPDVTSSTRRGTRSDHRLQRRRLLAYLHSLAERRDDEMPTLEEILVTVRRMVPGATLGLGPEADEVTTPQQTVAVRPSSEPVRTQRSRWAPIAALGMAIVVGSTALGIRISHDSPQRATEQSSSSTTEEVDVDRSRAMAAVSDPSAETGVILDAESGIPPEAPIVSIGASRYRIGRSGDTAVVLAPDCDRQTSIYLFRPESGVLFVFDSLATSEVDTAPTSRFPLNDVSSIEADVDPFTGCNALAITFADGHREHFTRPRTP